MFLNGETVPENLDICIDIDKDFVISVKQSGKKTQNHHQQEDDEDLSRFLLEALVEEVEFKMQEDELAEILMYKHY